jgi:hypothetical protein
MHLLGVIIQHVLHQRSAVLSHEVLAQREESMGIGWLDWNREHTLATSLKT